MEKHKKHFFLDNRRGLCFYAVDFPRSEGRGPKSDDGKKVFHYLVLVLLLFCAGLPAA